MKITWQEGMTVTLKMGNQHIIFCPQPGVGADKATAELYPRTQEKRPQYEETRVVDWPGEYDVSGFSMRVFESENNQGALCYLVHSKGGNICLLGEINEYPQNKLIEQLSETHVLILPLSTEKSLSPKDAFKLVEALEPQIVIPVGFNNGEDLAGFLKEMDVKLPEPEKFFEVKKSNVDTEKMSLVLLQKSK